MVIIPTEFDEGHLSTDPVAAEEEIRKTLTIMEDTESPIQPEESPIRYVFQTTWDRLKKVITIPVSFPFP